MECVLLIFNNVMIYYSDKYHVVGIVSKDLILVSTGQQLMIPKLVFIFLVELFSTTKGNHFNHYFGHSLLNADKNFLTEQK